MLDGPQTHSSGDQPTVGYILRLFWMAFGNVALFFAGLSIASSERIGTADAVYGGLVLALWLARWVDVTKLNGMTVHTEPATRMHLRRYSVALFGISLAGWGVARWLSSVGS